MRHPGIRIDRIPAAGLAGFIFAAGILAVGLIGLPPARTLLAIAAVGGLLLAALLYLRRR